MWKLGQSILGGDDEEREDDFFDQTTTYGLCALSYSQRIYGFAACLISGFLCIFLWLCGIHNYTSIMPFVFPFITSMMMMVVFRSWLESEELEFSFVIPSFIVFIKPIKFALLFTFGNMLAVGSTAFLIGPAEQLRKMFDPIRVYATAVYLGCVFLALICAILIHSKVLTLLAMISEICALIWYSLSYIPFARRVVSDLMIRLFDTEI